MKKENQKIKSYRLNEDFVIECEMGEVMAVRVVQVSLPWMPVIEEYNNITNKDVGNQVFKELSKKYALRLFDSVIIR